MEAGRNCSILEEKAIYDLFQGALNLYRNMLLEEVSSDTKLILGQSQQHDAKTAKSIQELSSQISVVQNLIIQYNKVTDPQTIETAYFLLSDVIWDGQLAEALDFLPVLVGQNTDLENALKIKLSVLSDDSLSVSNPLDLWKKICNPNIKDDVFRLLLLENINTPDKLSPYITSISNPTLKKIAESIAANYIDEIIIKTESIQDNITYYYYKIAEGLESEQWLIQRLLILSIGTSPAYNGSISIRNLIEKPNFIDQLYIWELYFNEIIRFDFQGERIEAEETRTFYKKMKSKVPQYAHARIDLKKRFYLLLIRTSLLLKDPDIENILDSVPKSISELPEIEACRFEFAIDKGIADQDTIIQSMLHTEQYWLLARYCESLNNYQAALDVINQVTWLIGKSPEIFEFAVIATSQTKGREAAWDLLKKYENQFLDYAIFWIRAYYVSETDEDRHWAVNSIIEKLNQSELKSSGLSTQKTLAGILIMEGKYTEALNILSSIEQIGYGNSDITRMKIQSYINTNRPIDALSEINQHYDELKYDDQILDLYLVISLNFKRSIKENILSDAKKTTNAWILMLAAKAEYIRKHIDEAEHLAMQSMLISNQKDEDFFDLAISFFVEAAPENDKKTQRIAENTFFEAENLNDHSHLTVCIYKENILPKPNYQWKDALHIHVDDAISMNFMRLSLGDIIEYHGESYEITSIAPLSAFYFRVCMDSMLQQGKAWTVCGEGPEEMMQRLVAFYRQNSNWNRHDRMQLYSDFSQLALPVFTLKQETKLEYAQLMRVLMDDPAIVVREFILPIRTYKNREFILTYTALVELHKLGINPSEYCDKIIVPSSIITEAEYEADNIYRRNNQDIVASIAFQDDVVQFIESSEEVKRENIRQAIDFKVFASKFKSLENQNDTFIPGIDSTSFVELIGVCDYDAVILAHSRDAVLITGEMLTAELTKLEAIKADTAGIADFLCLLNLPIMKLLEAVEQMLNYRFYAAITPTVVTYIADTYTTSNEEEQEAIAKAWGDILRIPENISTEDYRSKFKLACLEALQLLKNEGVDFQHRIVRIFYISTLYYNDYRICCYVQNGEVYYKFVQVENEQAYKDSELPPKKLIIELLTNQ